MDLTEEVKAISPSLSSESHDMYLSIMVPALKEYVMDLCNNQFTKDSNGDTVFPGPVKIFIAKACEYNTQKSGLKERSMGSVSYSYDLEFPNSLHQYLRPYRRLKFHANR